MFITFIVFPKDVCDCGMLDLVKVWVGGMDGGSVWDVDGIIP